MNDITFIVVSYIFWLLFFLSTTDAKTEISLLAFLFLSMYFFDSWRLHLY